MKTIKLKNKSLQLDFDAAAMYRFSRGGGEAAAVSDSKAAANFADAVLITWAMLKGDSATQYPTPESLAELFFPLPDAAVLEEIAALANAGIAGLKSE